MALQDLSDPGAVRAAIAEFDQIGQAAFLTKYGFGPARRYQLQHGRRLYDSKAVVAAAHGYQFGQPLTRFECSGGVGPQGAARKLRALGFTVLDRGQQSQEHNLMPGSIYSWDVLAARFDFSPEYPGIAGGMISRPQHDALLLITHPSGARSFDYGDTWDDGDLIYTGRGKRGDQRYEGQNRDVGDNARALYVFEPAGSRALLFVGQATCIDSWSEAALDLDGRTRRVLRFRLRFDAGDSAAAGGRDLSSALGGGLRRSSVSRPFDPKRVPTVPARALQHRSADEIARLREKATRGHHQILLVLDAHLRAARWTEVVEMPTAIDLWGRDPSGQRVIFEAKTLRAGTERARMRSALAQLLEYRYAFGDVNDRMCVVTDAAVSAERVAFFDALGIGIAVCLEGHVYAGSPTGQALLGPVLA